MSGYKRKGFHEVMQVDEEWMIMNLEDYTVTTVNEVGNFCWEQLADEQTTEAIVSKVSKQYHVKEQVAAEDVGFFLLKLQECGLIEDVS
ncbi:PqqD family protein [Halobacillus sp. BBL2006]|uniref:PqqD family protein n=1 Tax=Halobacillus sp. BBL2006 TaxID=1543706 RepID=UPI0005443817|nr:PqqD family protein [Halobacillus sp. BBL2006]KHE71667.1 hypothetical protein LD39_08585 [Halobacillus sp. BBL2006]